MASFPLTAGADFKGSDRLKIDVVRHYAARTCIDYIDTSQQHKCITTSYSRNSPLIQVPK